jgi:site-specific DNA-methyltransferase (adenine-specific)
MDLLIKQGLKFDAIITDPPYGTTACNWDSIIPFDKMWTNLKKLRNNNTPIILFGNEPFSSNLRISNIKEFKYDWIWQKSKCGSAFTAKYRPLQKHETVSVFGKGKIVYNPQLEDGKPYYRKRGVNNGDKTNNHKLGVVSESETINSGFRYPSTVQYFQQKWRRQDQVHPTQKPLELMEYIINTYTNEGDTILDFTCGSGTTLKAAKNLNRKCIGIELEEKYCEITKQRLLNN